MPNWMNFGVFMSYKSLEVPHPMGASFPPWSTTRCTKLTGLAESAGKKDPTTQPPPP